MIRIENEKQLLESFRPLERDEVILPFGIEFPLVVRDYHAWVEPSGHRVFLVFSDAPRRPPLGIVFRRDQGGAQAARMCEFCHSVRSGDGVTLLTASASANRRVGIQLCRDLNCKDRLEQEPGTSDFPRNAHPREQLRRIVSRMSEFARRQLF
jgi:hypothetical protein